MSSRRLVLEDVSRIHFYEGGKRCPEDIILPSVMRAVLEYLREPDYGCKHSLAQAPNARILCAYSFLVGVSGAASFLSWKQGWHVDNSNLDYMSADPSAAAQRIFEAVGYAHEVVVKEDGRDNEAVFRRSIRESLERAMPVIGYGVIGPPEPSIIAGYDEDGDVLLGWSFFQSFPEFSAGVEFEPSGYFRKRNWFTDTTRLHLLGEKQPKPSLKDISRDTLRWMLQVARTPMVRPETDAPGPYRNRHNGLAAYDAWGEHLICDTGWPAGDEAALRAHHGIHNSAVGTVAEARWFGSVFLAQIAELFAAGPNRWGTAEHILRAAACYAAEHDLMWRIWDTAGGLGNPEAFRAMADPSKRGAMSEIVRQARDKDAQAMRHIEEALQ